jgi:hypothetical protein
VIRAVSAAVRASASAWVSLPSATSSASATSAFEAVQPRHHHVQHKQVGAEPGRRLDGWML